MGGRKCLVCGQNNASGEISYHKFPKNNTKLRKFWLRSLKLNENMVSANALVCSYHFLAEDFVAAGVKRFLRRHAIPSLPLKSTPIKSESVNKGSDGSSVVYIKDPIVATNVIESSSQEALTASETWEFDDKISPSLTSSDPLSIDNEVNTQKRKLSVVSQALDIGIVKKHRDTSKMTSTQSPQTSKSYRYFGDFEREDLEDPAKLDAFWTIAKNTVLMQRNKIVCLQRKNRKMTDEIKSLQELANHVKVENVIYDSRENN